MQVQHSHFWQENPETVKESWIPSEAKRKALHRWWAIQGLLLVLLLISLGILIQQSFKLPVVFAQLPNGMLLEAHFIPPTINKAARKQLVNDVLQMLYYQEGPFNYLDAIQNHVRPTIHQQTLQRMQAGTGRTNNTIHLEILETFETSFKTRPRTYFEAITRAVLVSHDKDKRQELDYFIRTHWEYENHRFILTAIMETTPGEYHQAFAAEKERLASLSREQLAAEMDIRTNHLQTLPQPARRRLP